MLGSFHPKPPKSLIYSAGFFLFLFFVHGGKLMFIVTIFWPLSTQGEQGTLPMCLLWPHHRGQCPKNTCCMKSQSHGRLWPPLLKLKYGNGLLTNNCCGSSCKTFNSNSNSRVFNSNFIFNSTNFNSNSNSNSGIGIELQFQFRNWIDPNPDCSISSANALETLPSCTKPSACS